VVYLDEKIREQEKNCGMMNPRRKRNLIVAFLVALYIVLGFFREFIFMNINEQIRVTYDTVYLHRPTESYVAPSMSWLSGFGYPTLYYSKWALTFITTLLFALLASVTIKNAFEDKGLVKITWIAYGAVFLAGLLFYLGGSLTGNRESTYDIARFLAGLTETPALLVILAASYLAIGRRN
jgi:hypothetical protein